MADQEKFSLAKKNVKRWMTDREKLNLIKKDVKRWNEWREWSPSVLADLRGLDLRGVDLGGANLEEVNLEGINLEGARLKEVNLKGANLSRTRMVGVNLKEADLREARLTEADLRGAELTTADLSAAYLFRTFFGDTNLRNARGLETCRHYGPSMLDGRTIARSGPLPPEFLRGCGLSDWEIQTAKLYQKGLSQEEITSIGYNAINLLTDDPIQYYSCFISYTNTDASFVTRLYERLQNSGVRCWYAPEDIQGGRKVHYQLDEAIRHHDKLLLILSPNSIQSNWVEYELRSARRRERTENRRMLFPLRLSSYEDLQAWECFDGDEGRDLAAEVREYFIPDFSQWTNKKAFDDAFEDLLRDLRADSEPGHA